MSYFTDNVSQVVTDPMRASAINLLVPCSKMIQGIRVLAAHNLRYDAPYWIDTEGKTIRVVCALDEPVPGPVVICNGGELLSSNEHEALTSWWSVK